MKRHEISTEAAKKSGMAGRARRTLAIVATAVAVLAAHACTFDTSGLLPNCERQECTGQIFRYGTTYPAANYPVAIDTDPPAASSWIKFDLTNPSEKLILFKEGAQTVKSIPDLVKGSYLLQASRTLSKSKKPDDLIRIDVSQGTMDRFWVAFDSRATVDPASWLGKSFRPVSPHTIIESTSMTTGLSKMTVKYVLWEPVDLGRPSQTISLGGNNAPGIQWPLGIPGDAYLVLVKTLPQMDPTSKTTIQPNVKIEICVPRDASIEQIETATSSGAQQALASWLARPENEKYRQDHADGTIDIDAPSGSCGGIRSISTALSIPKVCAMPGDAVAQPVNDWIRRSEAAIEKAASSATVTNGGQSSTTPIEGKIQFDVNAGNQVEIGGLTLFSEGVALSDGTPVAQVSFGQRTTIVADCADGLPPGPFRLCSSYAIPAGALRASGSALVSGNRLVVDLENSQAVAIEIDFNQRKFHMVGGPLAGSFDVGGGPIQIEVGLDLTGDFENFAPKASHAETYASWECLDNNQATVTLTASASFDDDGQSDIVDYRWVEDAGLASEKLLGVGESLTVPMSFGRHSVTLTVQDTRLVSDSETFDVEVVDSKIDSIQPPADVYSMQQDESGAVLDIGQAFGSDGCSGSVLATNDAPADGRFPLGVTEVHWTFDDQRGNILTHTQYVYVFTGMISDEPARPVETIPIWSGAAPR